MNWPAYPEYRDSGVEWLGDMPTDWVAARTEEQSISSRKTLNERQLVRRRESVAARVRA